MFSELTGGKDLVTWLVSRFFFPLLLQVAAKHWGVYRGSNESYPSNCCSVSQTPPKIQFAVTFSHIRMHLQTHRSNLFTALYCTSHLWGCFLGKQITSVAIVNVSVKQSNTRYSFWHVLQARWSTLYWRIKVNPVSQCQTVICQKKYKYFQ